MISSKLIPSLFVAALAIGVAAPAEAKRQDNTQVVAGLVAAAVNVQTGDIEIVDLENVLRNADIRILNNALNNNNVEVLTIKNSNVLNDFLNNNDIDVNVLNDLVDIGVIDINIEDNTVELLSRFIVAVNALGGTTIFVLP